MKSRSPRQLALSVLLKCEKDGAYSTLALQDALERSGADVRDRAFVTSLVYGVIERKITLDYEIGLYLKQPLKKLNPTVLQILRLGAYQLLFSDKIHAGAAVNESVRLAKENGAAYASGLVNAVLRKISNEGLILPDKSDPGSYLPVAVSCPRALTDRFAAWFGNEEAERILSSFLLPRPVFIRVNSRRTNADALCDALRAEGVDAAKTGMPNALRISGFGDLTALRAYRDGLFFVQDLSSQLCAAVLGARPGDTVVDCCAAPGGKAFSAALDLEDSGRLLAFDLYPHRTALIEKGASRLGLRCVEAVCADARTLPQRGITADRVLCDAPCSGLGVIGRKPEIKYKDVSEMDALPSLQYEILTACSSAVKAGGTLVYSTCTLNPAENEAVCDRFLAGNPAFRPAEPDPFFQPSDGRYLTVFPERDGGDGFFIAKFIREPNYEN